MIITIFIWLSLKSFRLYWSIWKVYRQYLIEYWTRNSLQLSIGKKLEIFFWKLIYNSEGMLSYYLIDVTKNMRKKNFILDQQLHVSRVFRGEEGCILAATRPKVFLARIFGHIIENILTFLRIFLEMHIAPTMHRLLENLIRQKRSFQYLKDRWQIIY